jgi:hypothetical protein
MLHAEEAKKLADRTNCLLANVLKETELEIRRSCKSGKYFCRFILPRTLASTEVKILLDQLIPILEEAGYRINMEDAFKQISWGD